MHHVRLIGMQKQHPVLVARCFGEVLIQEGPLGGIGWDELQILATVDLRCLVQFQIFTLKQANPGLRLLDITARQGDQHVQRRIGE